MVFDIYIYGLIINFRINISLLEFCFMLQIYLGNVQIGILKVTMNNWIFYLFFFQTNRLPKANNSHSQCARLEWYFIGVENWFMCME